MGTVTFTKKSGGLARPLPGEDHISGLLVFRATLPSGFSSIDRVKPVTDITAAEDLGIVDTKIDETKATGGKIKITAAGAAATIWTAIMDGVTLGTYTVQTLDAVGDVATGLGAAINAGTGTHGYSCTVATDSISLVAPSGLGDSINGGTLVVSHNSGAGTSTDTQFSGGVDAYWDVIHYHIKEFFRINPGALLYVGIYDVPSTYNFNEVISMQNAVGGKIKQMGVYMGHIAFALAHHNALQARSVELDAVVKPLSFLYAADMTGLVLSNLDDLRSQLNPKVSVIAGQDGANLGAALFADKEYSISCLGAALGATSKAKVHENIGHVEKFNMAGDNELEVPAFADGTLLSTMTDFAINAVDVKGYIFIKRYPVDANLGYGTYFNDNHCCVTLTSDYAYLNDNRVMDKAIRSVYARILPQINGPVKVDPVSGKLDPAIISYIENMGNQALEQMESAGELSGYKTVIDPDQNLLQNSRLQVSIVNVPIGVSRNIDINISFSTKL